MCPFIYDVVWAIVGGDVQFALGGFAATGPRGILVVSPGSDPLSCFPVSVREVPALWPLEPGSWFLAEKGNDGLTLQQRKTK